MTLVEVLVGLAILGTVLSLVLVARGRHLRQMRRSTRSIEAVEAADQLMQTWWRDPEVLSRAVTGHVEKSKGLTWRVIDTTRDSGTLGDATVRRLEILEASANSGGVSTFNVLASVEFLDSKSE